MLCCFPLRIAYRFANCTDNICLNYYSTYFIISLYETSYISCAFFYFQVSHQLSSYYVVPIVTVVCQSVQRTSWVHKLYRMINATLTIIRVVCSLMLTDACTSFFCFGWSAVGKRTVAYAICFPSEYARSFWNVVVVYDFGPFRLNEPLISSRFASWNPFFHFLGSFPIIYSVRSISGRLPIENIIEDVHSEIIISLASFTTVRRALNIFSFITRLPLLTHICFSCGCKVSEHCFQFFSFSLYHMISSPAFTLNIAYGGTVVLIAPTTRSPALICVISSRAHRIMFIRSAFHGRV